MKFQIEKILFILLIFSFPFFNISAQEKQISPVQNEDCGLTDAPLVQLNVSVSSSKSGYLKDLTYKDFEIYDGKERQEIEFFKQENRPASIGVLFDLSGSVTSYTNDYFSETPYAVRGLETFLNQTNPDNDYFLIGFSDRIKLFLDTTKDVKKVRETLNELLEIKPEGNTNFYDALEIGFGKIKNSTNNKKVLVLITDGLDNSSQKANLSDVEKIAKQQNVLLYMVNILTKDDFRDINTLEYAENKSGSLVKNSGGRVFNSKKTEDVNKVFAMLAEELKTQYTICFTPKTSSKKNHWRKIEVKIQIPKEREKEFGKVSVRTKKEIYF